MATANRCPSECVVKLRNGQTFTVHCQNPAGHASDGRSVFAFHNAHRRGAIIVWKEGDSVVFQGHK